MTASVKIRVSIEARQALRDIGKKGETYDAVIRRLVKYYVLEELSWDGSPILGLLDMEEEVKD